MNNIYITEEAHERIMACVKECEYEINGIARYHIDETKRVVIDEVAVLKQEVTGGSASHDTASLIEFLAPRDDRNQWRVQWHSHVHMDTFWSGTDEQAISSIGETANFLISLVFNKSKHYKARLDIFQPLRVKEDLTLLIIDPAENPYTAWAKEQIAEKVSTPVANKNVVVWQKPNTDGKLDDDFDEFWEEEENRRAGGRTVVETQPFRGTQQKGTKKILTPLEKTEGEELDYSPQMTGITYNGKLLVSDLWDIWREVAEMFDMKPVDLRQSGYSTADVLQEYEAQHGTVYIDDNY